MVMYNLYVGYMLKYIWGDLVDINQLKYIIEIDKAQSISKAAQNLFMGQPNLSKSLRSIENSLGIVIFKRTPTGVTTTRNGKLIVQKAKKIVEQMDELEELFFKEEELEQEITLSSCKNFFVSYCIREFLSKNDEFSSCKIKLKKANAFESVNDIKNGISRYCAVRFKNSQTKKYTEYFKKNGMTTFVLREFIPMVLVSKKSPLAKLSIISKEDLEDKTLIYGAEDFPLEWQDDFKEDYQPIVKNTISISDCEGGLLILKGIENSFMFSSPLPKKMLEEEGLLQIPTSFLKDTYVDAWIWKFHKQHLPEENGFFTVVINSSEE